MSNSNDKLPTVNFRQALRRLLSDRGISQRQLADAIGITPANISHYLSARRDNLPNSTTLIRMASALRVSLDELVYDLAMPAYEGSANPTPYYNYIDSKMEDVLRRDAETNDAVIQVGMHLSSHLRTIVAEYAKTNSLGGVNNGVIENSISYEMEKFAKEIFIFTVDLDYEMKSQDTVGQFFDVMRDNMKAEKEYEILFPHSADNLAKANAFTRLMTNELGRAFPLTLKCLRTAYPNGCVKLKFDVAKMQRTAPLIFLKIKSYINSSGELWYVPSPNEAIRGDIAIRTELSDAYQAFYNHNWPRGELLFEGRHRRRASATSDPRAPASNEKGSPMS